MKLLACNTFFFLPVFLVNVLPVTESLTPVFVPTTCGSELTLSTTQFPGLHLESSTGMTYANLLDCNVTFTAASPYRVLASIENFDLEPQRLGACRDYINLYDGGDLSGSTLNTAVLCGNSLTTTTFISSGQQMTVHFVTDATATYYGFSIYFSIASVAPCASSQHTCNNSYCIPSSLACDDYNECGDNSDEDNCTAVVTSSSYNWTPVIVGVSLGLLVCLLIAAYAVYRYRVHNRWKKFHNDHIDQDDLPDPDSSYPVTHKYFRGIRGHHPDIHTYRATEGNDKGKQLSDDEVVKT